MSKKTVMCYVGVSPASCGHWVAAMVDEGEAYRKDTAKELADWVRRGYTIERHDVEAVRVTLASCDLCCPKRRAEDRQRASRATQLPLEVA